MKRALIRSTAFIRAAKHLVKKHPAVVNELQTVLTLLAENAFDPRLKTHKLKGNLVGSWACSGGYDLRIIFEFVPYEGSEAILLQSIGTHDEVY